MKVCKLKSDYQHIGCDNVKTFLSIINRVIEKNITYENVSSLQDIKNGMSERLKDICNWLNRPAGAKYYAQARKAYCIYHKITD
jgi:hypothetical protein